MTKLEVQSDTRLQKKKIPKQKGEEGERGGCANPLNPPLVYVNMQERSRERESKVKGGDHVLREIR